MDKNKYLGCSAKDKLSGFKGTITGYCQYLTGCDQYFLLPKTEKKNKYPDGHWFDSNRLEIDDLVIVKIDTLEEKGSDFNAPTGY